MKIWFVMGIFEKGSGGWVRTMSPYKGSGRWVRTMLRHIISI